MSVGSPLVSADERLVRNNVQSLGATPQGFFNTGDVVGFGFVTLMVTLGHDDDGFALTEACSRFPVIFYVRRNAARHAQCGTGNQKSIQLHRRFLQ
jgi:hypothetical protein